MIKIDLHIHTVASAKDRPFTFSEERLREYVSVRDIGCIAITNHNLFDLKQFLQIQKELQITVLPGIEIDLEGGQLLLISDDASLENFSQKCQQVSKECPTIKDCLTLGQLNVIFPDLSKYLLIPHYEKKPKLEDDVIEKLKPHITAGEVTSPKKFVYCLNDKARLVPVFFSDFRSDASQSVLPFRQTYLDCNETTFFAIKNCLRDKNKVSLTPGEGKSLFQIFEDGQELSTGLNVILGGRSTGKSHTLARIFDQFPNSKYIEQFSLVTRDAEDDERRFNKILSDGHSLQSKEYLAALEGVVRDVMDVDLEDDARSVERYLDSLLKYAKETEKHDAYSKAKLYGEDKFETLDSDELKKLIASTKNLIKNEEFKEIISEFVSIENLTKLMVRLMREHGKREFDRIKKVWLNELIQEIKDRLQIKTAATKVENIDLYSVMMNLNKVEKFRKTVESARKTREIMRKSLQGYEIVAEVGEFQGALELKRISKARVAFSDAFQHYASPYEFLQDLKEVGIEEADFHKYFAKIDYKILNKDGFEASGGERSEFNLLLALQDSQNSDMLLLDEPESSFDNLFLNKEVNECIRDISRRIPVVVVTHNSTVGASIKPNYLIYTKKEILSGKAKYRVYSGCPTDKILISRDGKSISTRDIMLDCLEAGEETYDERRRGYEDIRN